MDQYKVVKEIFIFFLKGTRKLLGTSDIATDFKTLSLYEERLLCPMLHKIIFIATNSFPV